MKTQKNLIQTLIELIDQLVELALSNLIEPVLELHARTQRAMEGTLRQFVLDQKHMIPSQFWKEGNLAYLRIGMVLPTLVFLSWGQAILPATLVLFVHVAAFLEGLESEYDTSQSNEDANSSSDCTKEGEGQSQQTEEEAFGKFHSTSYRISSLKTIVLFESCSYPPSCTHTVMSQFLKIFNCIYINRGCHNRFPALYALMDPDAPKSDSVSVSQQHG
jgi:hypothetical protein